MIIDTHAHLYAKEFDSDIDDVIARAKRLGIEKILLPNIDSSSIESLHHLCKKKPDIFYPMMGLHPCSVDESWKTQLKEIEAKLFSNKYIAVGEIGMDLYWDKSFCKHQQEAFKIQIEWSIALDLPIVIHARDSFEEIFDVLACFDSKQLKGVFHCFTGGEEEVKKIRSLGDFLFGIGGVVTYKNSNLPSTLSSLSLDELIVETDAPYLPPVPYRGKRNESSYVVEVITKLASIYHVSIDEVSKKTTLNAEKLFNLKSFKL